MPPRARAPKPDPEPLSEAPTRIKGYYKTPYGRFKSVTTIIDGGFPKPNLIPWAGRVVAEQAVEQLPWLLTLRGQDARDDAIKWLKNEHKRIKDEAADHGTLVHRYLEQRFLGAPTPTPTNDHLAAAYKAVEHFLDTMRPDLEAAELVVANPEQGYAGTGDAWLRFPRHQVTIPGVRYLDAKSGKGAWGETGMQAGAYQRARIGWLRDGREVEPPATQGADLLHIRPPGFDGPDSPGAGPDGWELIPLDTSDRVHDVFLHVMAVSANTYFIDKKVLGTPYAQTPDEIDATDLDELTTTTDELENA